MIKLYLQTWKRAFSFKGRSTRKEWWGFVAITLFTCVSLIFVQYSYHNLVGAIPQYIYMVFTMTAIFPFMSVTTRRLHDLDLSSQWSAIYFLLFPINVFAGHKLPVIVINDSYSASALGMVSALLTIVLLIAMTVKGTRGVNRFGLPSTNYIDYP